MATQCVYDFWLYELCDIYIEAMKPLSSETAEESIRRSAQDTLYTCLDLGLRMLHPFMPFVTEELWQRLPRRPEDKTISIAVSAFPESVSTTYKALIVDAKLSVARTIPQYQGRERLRRRQCMRGEGPLPCWRLQFAHEFARCGLHTTM